MRYPAEETAARHERLLDAAARLLRERGLDALSVSDAMKAAGMTHGAFYAHFDSKEAMLAAGVERALDGMLTMADATSTAADPRGAYAAPYLTRRHRDNPGHGCAMAALAPEIARRGGPVRGVFTRAVAALVERLAPRFGTRTYPDRAEAIAAVSAMLGALLLARAVDDPALSDEILATARARFGLAPEA